MLCGFSDFFVNYSFFTFIQEHAQKRWYEPIEKLKSEVQLNIKETEDVIFREDGQKYIFQAKRVCNVDFYLKKLTRKCFKICL